MTQDLSTSGLRQCPVCMESYPPNEIEEHAANCSSWLVDSAQPQDLIDEDEASEVEDNPPDYSELKKDLKNEVQRLSAGWCLGEPVRITIRRKHLWSDFKAARRKLIRSNSNLKVVFVGEPAVDDGGPKREVN